MMEVMVVRFISSTSSEYWVVRQQIESEVLEFAQQPVSPPPALVYSKVVTPFFPRDMSRDLQPLTDTDRSRLAETAQQGRAKRPN
jgi:hypothetical protein